MAQAESVNGEAVRTVLGVEHLAPSHLNLTWSDGRETEIDFSTITGDPAFQSLRDDVELAKAEIGEWGHSLVWPGGAEIGVDSLWLEALRVEGKHDAADFLSWRYRHALSVFEASEALGITTQSVVAYSDGAVPVPRTVLLALRGWEASKAA